MKKPCDSCCYFVCRWNLIKLSTRSKRQYEAKTSAMSIFVYSGCVFKSNDHPKYSSCAQLVSLARIFASPWKMTSQQHSMKMLWIPCGFALCARNAKPMKQRAYNVGTKLAERHSKQGETFSKQYERTKWNAWAQAKSGVIIQHSCRFTLSTLWFVCSFRIYRIEMNVQKKVV